MRYVIYARKSTESEDRQVQSIDDQLDVLRRLAVQRGLNVVEELVESKSAKEPGCRPVFMRLLAELQAGRVQGILCWNINRLSRNPVDSGTLSWMLQRGAICSILTPEREYRPEDNVVLWAVESGVANQFILDLRKAVARGTRSKVEKGWYPHRAPEGYRNNVTEKTVVVDGERFALLREAWDMMLTGAHTVPQIQAFLTRRGFRTKKTRRSGGKGMSRSALYRIFGNPFYMGEFVHEGRAVHGAHPAMVTRDEFRRVQALLGRENHIQPKKMRWAFTGLIRCGLCGSLVTAERKVKQYKMSGLRREYVYYHCCGRDCRPKTSVSEEVLEAQIADLLKRCELSDAFWDWCITTWEETDVQAEGTERASQAQTIRALSQAKARRERLFEMRSDGEISREEFITRSARADEEIADLKIAWEEAEGKAERDKQTVQDLATFSTTAYIRFNGGGVEAKREVACAMGAKMSLTLGNLGIEPHPLLDAIRRIEPVEIGSDKQKKGTPALPNPAWWAMRDNIRTALVNCDTFSPAFKLSR